MGISTSTSRSALRLVVISSREKFSRSFPLCTRRFSTVVESSSETESQSESGMDEKSLYLCFSEFSRCGGVNYATQVARRIRLKCNYDDEDKVEDLPVATYKRSKVNMTWKTGTLFGSDFLIPFGRTNPEHFSWIDTSTRPIKFHGPPKETKIRSFSAGENHMVLGEIDGKLYCISNNPRGMPHFAHPFAVLDPENDLNWRYLDTPPFTLRNEKFDAIFVKGSNKILGWEIGKPGVYSFDVDRPENGWMESTHCLGMTLPFLSYDRLLVIRSHHPELGYFNMIFSYDPCYNPSLVSTYLMSNTCDSLKFLNTQIELPGNYYKYQYYADLDLDDDGYPIDQDKVVSSGFFFVQLGTKKFCLGLHRYDPTHHVRGRNIGILCLITIEYDIIVNTGKDFQHTVEIQLRSVEERYFKYRCAKLRKPEKTLTEKVYMTGAFLH